jgi:anti-sigma B factor antagonist
MATVERWNDSELATRQGPFSLRVEQHPGEMYLVELLGELDLAGAQLAWEHLERAAASDCKEVVIDLAGLDFIDSTGLGVLVRVHAKERSAARLRFLGASGAVARVIALTGLDEVLSFAD